MPSEKDNILEYNQYMKSDKISYIIYADIESLIREIDGCANSLEISSIIKKAEHIPYGYSMSTIWEFDHIENKQTLYCGKDCMKMFCESLREHAKNIIDFEMKKMSPLPKEELKSYQNANVYYICGKRLLKKFTNEKNY